MGLHKRVWGYGSFEATAADLNSSLLPRVGAYAMRAHTDFEGGELRGEHLCIHQLREGCEVLLVLVDLLDAQQL